MSRGSRNEPPRCFSIPVLTWKNEILWLKSIEGKWLAEGLQTAAQLCGQQGGSDGAPPFSYQVPQRPERTRDPGDSAELCRHWPNGVAFSATRSDFDGVSTVEQNRGSSRSRARCLGRTYPMFEGRTFQGRKLTARHWSAFRGGCRRTIDWGIA